MGRPRCRDLANAMVELVVQADRQLAIAAEAPPLRLIRAGPLDRAPWRTRTGRIRAPPSPPPNASPGYSQPQSPCVPLPPSECSRRSPGNMSSHPDAGANNSSSNSSQVLSKSTGFAPSLALSPSLSLSHCLFPPPTTLPSQEFLQELIVSKPVRYSACIIPASLLQQSLRFQFKNNTNYTLLLLTFLSLSLTRSPSPLLNSLFIFFLRLCAVVT